MNVISTIVDKAVEKLQSMSVVIDTAHENLKVPILYARSRAISECDKKFAKFKLGIREESEKEMKLESKIFALEPVVLRNETTRTIMNPEEYQNTIYKMELLFKQDRLGREEKKTVCRTVQLLYTYGEFAAIDWMVATAKLPFYKAMILLMKRALDSDDEFRPVSVVSVSFKAIKEAAPKAAFNLVELGFLQFGPNARGTDSRHYKRAW